MYTSIKKLANKLVEAGVPFSFKAFEDGYQISFRKNGYFIGDATEWKESYGSDKDEIELFGDFLTAEELLNDSVIGNLKVEECFDRIVKTLGICVGE